MLIFEPYTSTAEIHAELGYNWSAAETTHIRSSDAFHLLVFLKDGKVVQYFKVWRRIGDFEGLETRRRFARKDAVFTVVRVSDGANSRLRFSPKSGEGLILRGAAMPGGGSINLSPGITSDYRDARIRDRRPGS